MKQMVMMVLNNPERCMTLMEAWDEAGAPGITILESTGLVSLRQSGARDDLPLLPSLMDLMRTRETHHRTIFTVVEDDAQAQTIIDATEKVFEVFEAADNESSGVLFVLPVSTQHNFATRRAQEKIDRGQG